MSKSKQDKDVKDSALNNENLNSEIASSDVEVIADDIYVANQTVVDVAVVKNPATDEAEDKAEDKTPAIKDSKQEDKKVATEETKVFSKRVAEVLGDENAEKMADFEKATKEEVAKHADTVKQKTEDLQSKAKDKMEDVKQQADDIKDGVQQQIDVAKDKVDELKDIATDEVSKLTETAADKVEQAKDKATKTADELKQTAQNKLDDAKDTVADLKDNATDKVAKLQDTANDTAESVKDGVQEQVDIAKDKADELKESATDKVSEVKETISNKVFDIKETAGETLETAKSKAEGLVATLKDKIQEVKDTAEDKFTHAKQTAQTKLDEAKDKADELKETASEETASIQETIQEKVQAGKDELTAKKEELLEKKVELLAKKEELVEKATTFKDDLQADLADKSNAGFAGKLSLIGAYFASIYATKERYEAVDLKQNTFGENAFRRQGSQIGQQLLGAKGATVQNLASKVVSENKMNAVSEAIYRKIASWASAWAKSDLAKDERFDVICSLSDDERETFADDIANQNRALATAGGVSGLFGLKGVVADTAWLLMVSLKSVYQLSIIYDKPLTGKEGAKLAYGILSACNLDKLQEKQVIMTALALGDRVLKEAQTTSLSEELKKIGRQYQDRSYSKSLDEISKFVNLDRFNPKWLHYILPVGSVAVSAHYNNELIEEVLGVAKATFSNKPIKGLIEDKTASLEALDSASDTVNSETTDDHKEVL